MTRLSAIRTAAAVLAAAALLAAAAPRAAAQRPAAPSTGPAWRFVVQPQSSVVLARDGSVIGEVGREMRTSVSIRTLPRYLPQAFVAVEDKRFYQHDGVDVVGVLGALRGRVMGERMRGASTITQQLVGNMHPDVIDRADLSIARKLREQEAAREMERHYSKEQILEAYLNQVDFGHHWFGVESAARHYFGKPAARLTLAEAASLAALPKSPPGYDPIAHPGRNAERRNLVLGLMAEQGYVSPAQAHAAQAAPVVTAPAAATAPWFVDVARAQAERAGVPVGAGGYRIQTTLDPLLQRAAVNALAEGAAEAEARPGYRHATLARHAPGAVDYLQGAVVVLDAATGEVRALVGGRSYADSPFDRAVDAVRQPGSAFKPFVYAAAVAAGLPPNETVYDTALAIPVAGGRAYRPANADAQFLGALTMREALTRSRNPVAVQLAQEVGMDSVAALARRAGIASPIAPGPASAIGASAVRPLELVAAYTAFADDGVAVSPRFVTRVDDAAGRVAWSPPASARRPAMDPRVAFIVRDMMRDVVDRGTASAVRRWVPPAVPVAGKTGTTNDNADVWFVGLTPDLVAGVWLGFDRPTPLAGVAGGSLAAPVFARIVAQYYAGRAPGDWTPPDGLVTAELDRATGLPADDATPADRRYTEYFLPGTEPGALRFDPLSLFTLGPVGR